MSYELVCECGCVLPRRHSDAKAAQSSLRLGVYACRHWAGGNTCPLSRTHTHAFALTPAYAPTRRGYGRASITHHSSFRHCVGFVLAALIACIPTVSHAMEIARRPAPTKYHHCNVIRNAKLSSHCSVIK